MKYTQKQLENAFDIVADSSDWKAPIQAEIPRCQHDLNLLTEAVIHFTGTIPTIKPVGSNRYLIEAVGYRNGPCGP